jgi:stage V sporulation protein D (sporulation-specific penicillin-binding protein)
MKFDVRDRTNVVLIFVLLFALALVIRLYFVQIVHGESFSDKADRQYVRSYLNLYDRGSIFMTDREGRLVSAASLRGGYTVAINPKIIDDPASAYEKLSTRIDIDKETFTAQATKDDDPYEEIAHRISENEAVAVEHLLISGVTTYKDRWRYYPGESLASQTVGFVGYDGDELRGRYGLERYYDSILARDGDGVSINFFAEVFANINQAIFTDHEGSGGDVVTSLEPSVQLLLERELRDIAKLWSPKLTAGVVLDPDTGEIYAMATYPTFNLNEFGVEASPQVYKNILVENVYELGSIVKPLTLAAGLDSGSITPSSTYFDEGVVQIDNESISNYDGRGRGWVNMQEVLNQSLNTGAYHVVKKMGKDTFREYLYKFELDEETGIDLPGETRGLLDNLESGRTIEHATASFGQGIATTPIAMVRALSAVANGGELVTPHIASYVSLLNGDVKYVSSDPRTQVISEESSEEITKMLVEAVDTALLSGSQKRDRYSIAAKTGTAQIAKEGERGYYDDRALHSFFGYFPAYDPKFLIFLMTVEPKGARFATDTIVEPFFKISDFLISYYSIPPDR